MAKGTTDALSGWNAVKSAELYGVDAWGRNYFGVSPDGFATVRLSHRGKPMDVKFAQIVQELRERGMSLPVLLRFSDILADRIRVINETFAKAVKDYGYRGVYRGVYPIKVNQQQQAVQDVVRFGRPWHHGLEAGSKAELIADDAGAGEPGGAGHHPARGRGDGREAAHRHPREAEQQGGGEVERKRGRPLGLRAHRRADDRGGGPPARGGAPGLPGDAALPPRLPGAEHPRDPRHHQRGEPLLRGAGEGGRADGRLRHRRRAGHRLRRQPHELREQRELRHLGVLRRRGGGHHAGLRPRERPPPHHHQRIRPRPHRLLFRALGGRVGHDELRDGGARARPRAGGRAPARLHREPARRLQAPAHEEPARVFQRRALLPRGDPESLQAGPGLPAPARGGRPRLLVHPHAHPRRGAQAQVRARGSLEKPTRSAHLSDITCDCDGQIDKFIDLHDVKHALPLHPVKDGDDYILGAFLVGAYQETLGDLHNLFGDTNIVSVSLDEDGDIDFTDEVEGDTVEEVLSYVEYDTADLVSRFRRLTDAAVKAKRITPAERRRILSTYANGLRGYTYFEL